MGADFDAGDLKAIAFDVFGTVVDWHSGIAAEAERALPGVDGAAFALAWRKYNQNSNNTESNGL